MTLNEVIFIDNFPTIDLHGYDRDTARVATNDFINDNMKMKNASNQKKRDYYKEGMIMLFQAGENFQNYHQILKEYRNALFVREQRIDDLYNEIKIIKKLKV